MIHFRAHALDSQAGGAKYGRSRFGRGADQFQARGLSPLPRFRLHTSTSSHTSTPRVSPAVASSLWPLASPLLPALLPWLLPAKHGAEGEGARRRGRGHHQRPPAQPHGKPPRLHDPCPAVLTMLLLFRTPASSLPPCPWCLCAPSPQIRLC